MTPTIAPQALDFVVRTTATIDLPFKTILTEDQALEIAKNWGDPDDGIAYTRDEIEQAIASEFEFDAQELALSVVTYSDAVGRSGSSVTWSVQEPEFISDDLEVSAITRETELG